MTRRVYLYFALTFLLGVISGGAGFFYYGWSSGHWHRGFDKQHIVRHLTSELNLSPAQVQQLDQIMDGATKKYQDLQKQFHPQFEAVREETRNRIRKILTAEQLSKFNDLSRRWDERRKKQGVP